MVFSEVARLAERRKLFVGAAAVCAVALFFVTALLVARAAAPGSTADGEKIGSDVDRDPDDPAQATASTDQFPATPSTISAWPATGSTAPGTPNPDLAATLVAGDTGIEVLLVQRMLNIVVQAELAVDGVYGPATAAAIKTFQRSVGLPVTGEADRETRSKLAAVDAGRSLLTPTWPIPTIGDGGADGCQVAVIGDSLIDGTERVHADRLAEIGCAAAVDGATGRAMTFGWYCDVLSSGGRRSWVLLGDPQPGNDTCAPAGLELLEMWSNARALGDIVVLALGTNDALAFDQQSWVTRWERAVAFAGTRPVIVLTTQARPGASIAPAEAAYSEALRRWCATTERCVLADWALTDVANDAGSYRDSVHLVPAAADARASFIRDAVAKLLTGRPSPNPTPIPTPTTPRISTTTIGTTGGTSTATSTTSTSTTSSSTETSTTTTITTSTSTSTPSTSTTTSTSTPSTSTSVAAADSPGGG